MVDIWVVATLLRNLALKAEAHCLGKRCCRGPIVERVTFCFEHFFTPRTDHRFPQFMT